MPQILSSPSMSAKLKNRESARKIKHGSPKLQEMLRQRCRERMRQKRGQLFDRSRSGLNTAGEDVQEVLTEIVRQELSELETSASDWKDADGFYGFSSTSEGPLDADEALALESEMIAEEEHWIIEEYERLVRNEEEMLALFAEEGMKEEVFCPICERAALTEAQDAIVCNSCGLSLPPRVSITDMGKLIMDNLNTHSAKCAAPTSFVVIPENNNISLYLMCETCSAFSLII